MWLYIEKSDKRMDNDTFKGKQRDSQASKPSMYRFFTIMHACYILYKPTFSHIIDVS
jgi:hypothetical protein